MSHQRAARQRAEVKKLAHKSDRRTVNADIYAQVHDDGVHPRHAHRLSTAELIDAIGPHDDDD